MVDEFGAGRVLDVGCGTGTLATLLARGIDVTVVDPADASLDVARGKPHAERVHWVAGTAADVALPQVDVAFMTATSPRCSSLTTTGPRPSPRFTLPCVQGAGSCRRRAPCPPRLGGGTKQATFQVDCPGEGLVEISRGHARGR